MHATTDVDIQEPAFTWTVLTHSCLRAAHGHHIYTFHICGFQPSNLFLGEGGLLVRIGDFGLAKQLDGSKDTATAEVSKRAACVLSLCRYRCY